MPLVAHPFVLEAFDPGQWCPVLQARFDVADLAVLQTLLGVQADDDPELRHVYSLDESECAAVIDVFSVSFDSIRIDASDPRIFLRRLDSIRTAPYLVHTGYELPLLLDGRKKLAKMYECYPPMAFDGEERFDYWVAQGVLHRVEELEPFDPPIKGWDGNRTVYYTPKGEEWRIPAMQLLWRAASKSGGWNEHFERLEGMLFGYEDWQNDWWIESRRQRGGWGGASLCCAVTEAGLAWMEAAGFRALPPCETSVLTVVVYDVDDPAKMYDFLSRETDSVALVRFAVPLSLARDLLPVSPERGEPWLMPSERVPDLNRHLRDAIVVAMRRDDPS